MNVAPITRKFKDLAKTVVNKLKEKLDAGLAKGTVRVPAGYEQTAALGELMGEIEVVKA